MSKEKRYRLLKDLPDVSAGAIFELGETLDAYYLKSDKTETKYNCYIYPVEFVWNNKSWFEEIKEQEKDWQIVAFEFKKKYGYSDGFNHVGRNNDGTFGQYHVEEDDFMHGTHDIKSVRRKSDGEVFSVGEITDGNNKIHAFELFRNVLKVHMQSVSSPLTGFLTNIQSLTKQKKEERIEVKDYEFDRDEQWMKFYFNTDPKILAHHFLKCKQAIEGVLNDESYKCLVCGIPIKDGAKYCGRHWRSYQPPPTASDEVRVFTEK